MIITVLFTLLGTLISGIVQLLPEGTLLPANFNDMITDIIAYAYAWDWVVPMTTLFGVLSAIIIFMLAEFSWRIGKYAIHMVRGN